MAQTDPNASPTLQPSPMAIELHRVAGRFASSDQMQDAIGRLSLLGFDRADLAISEGGMAGGAPTPGAQAKTAYTDEDAQQARTLHVSGAATVAALAGAAITIGTGGVAAAAIGVALAAGAAAGGGAFAATTVANDEEQRDRDGKASAGTLILTVQTKNADLHAKAEAALRDAGATDVVPA
ncbi:MULTISPECIES: hypothetical protein [unclassified Acidisoma]|jgi:hypothetical protein|uniref:hypothetical protein n=1 Tax=unclassified Acidisoma TaxID=2634065 RepID=UPI00131D5FAD|nr:MULTISPECIES: hypothetical protein [unclassified Acidisoma]